MAHLGLEQGRWKVSLGDEGTKLAYAVCLTKYIVLITVMYETDKSTKQ